MAGERTRARRAAPEVRQADILEAALAEFAHHGFSGARMEDVARRARVSKGTVYLYYPTKQALFEALVRRDVAPRVELITFFLDSYDGRWSRRCRASPTWPARSSRTASFRFIPSF